MLQVINREDADLPLSALTAFQTRLACTLGPRLLTKDRHDCRLLFLTQRRETAVLAFNLRKFEEFGHLRKLLVAFCLSFLVKLLH